MEAGFLLEGNKSLVEEHFEAINGRFRQLQQSALDFSFPSNVSGMPECHCQNTRYCHSNNFLFFGIVKWLLEEADKTVRSNTFLAARMLTEAKNMASRISRMEVN
jgi:hypothetical protein